MSAWKQLERDAAALFGGKRAWANSGERLDFESATAIGQCKLVKTLSLEALTKLAEEMELAGNQKKKLGVVCVKRRRGKGKPSPMLVVMTDDTFKHIFNTPTYTINTISYGPEYVGTSAHAEPV